MVTYEYPAWHDEARRLAAQGVTAREIVKRMKLKISVSRVGQITAPKWKELLVLGSHSVKLRKQGIKPKANDFTEEAAKATFVPVERNFVRRTDNPQQEDAMPKERVFDTTKFVDPQTKQAKTGILIRCSKCNSTESYFGAGLVGGQFGSRKFQEKGWIVGGGPRADMCPSCNSSFKKKPVMQVPKIEFDPVAKTVGINGGQTAIPKPIPDTPLVTKRINERAEAFVNPPVAPAPAPTPAPEEPSKLQHSGTLGRMERRIITQVLEGVYGDEKTGYKDDWTDQKVADDLGVPKEWVATVRDETFGPEINASIKAAKVTELQKLAESIERAAMLIDAKLEAIQTLDEKVSKTYSDMSELTKRFEDLSAALKTQDKHAEDVITGFNKQYSEFKNLYKEFVSTI